MAEKQRVSSRVERQSTAKRTPFGVQRLKMSLDDATRERIEAMGLVPRWINDEDHGTRLRQAEAGGYVFITSNGTEQVGDVGAAQDKNRRIRGLVGTHKDGSAKYAYLMGIDKVYYEEDQAAKESQNKMVDDAIRGGSPSGLGHHGVNPDMGSTVVKNIDYKP